MIVKPWSVEREPSNKFEQAGLRAEEQMAHYLKRAFEETADLLVLHNLRLVDETRTEQNGSARVAQIDHLVLHRWGAFIVESKSVADGVVVRADGSWERKVHGQWKGMSSPIDQGHRQAAMMRALLQDHRERLLGKVMVGLRTYAKIAVKTEHRGFGQMPIQVVCAISDEGTLKGGGKPFLRDGFPSFLLKSHQVCDRIAEEFARHKRAGGLLSEPDGEYGMWAMKPEELRPIADFLAGRHTLLERPAAAPAKPIAARSTPVAVAAPAPAPARAPASPAPATAQPSCRGCGGAALKAMSGPYGYYWKCEACSGNTPMPAVCSLCGMEGKRGNGVRIRKEGAHYYRRCEACSIEEKIWTERG